MELCTFVEDMSQHHACGHHFGAWQPLALGSNVWHPHTSFGDVAQSIAVEGVEQNRVIGSKLAVRYNLSNLPCFRGMSESPFVNFFKF